MATTRKISHPRGRVRLSHPSLSRDLPVQIVEGWETPSGGRFYVVHPYTGMGAGVHVWDYPVAERHLSLWEGGDF